MMSLEEVIVKPVVTEKTNELLQNGKYTFRVNPKATKIEIAHAVEKLFDVKVIKVNTLSVKGKKKAVGVHRGMTSAWKKAIVTIDPNATPKTYLVKGGKTETEKRKYKESIDSFMGA